MVISRWFRCCAKLSIDFLKVSSWPNENFIGTVNDIVAIWADFPNTTLTVWKTAKAPKTESAKVQPLMQRIRKFSIRWNPLESRCSRIEQDKTGQWKRPSGQKGRRFKSCHLDQISTQNWIQSEWSSFLLQKAQKPCNHRPSEPSAISRWGKSPPRWCFFQVKISLSGGSFPFSFYPILFVILH